MSEESSIGPESLEQVASLLTWLNDRVSELESLQYHDNQFKKRKYSHCTDHSLGTRNEISSDQSWTDPHNNPHVAQIYLNRPHEEFDLDPPFHRILHDEAPERTYFRRNHVIKTVVHWGQRKLLLSEIEFLTLVGPENLQRAVVVYAGAAPGTHVKILSDMFPMVNFILVDPAPFTVKPTSKIQIIQDLCTDDLCRELAEKHDNILLISDVRSTDPFTDDEAKMERQIREDMQLQQHWHILLKSRRSILKFRLPWSDGTTLYLDGDIYLPVWGPQTTTESRLITSAENPLAMKIYDNRKYENQMFYFNTRTRISLYHHNVRGEGLDHCYDCRAEIQILHDFITNFGNYISELDVPRRIANVSRQISRDISLNRTLKDPTPDKAERRERIKKNQWKDGRPAYEVARERHRRV